MSQQFCLKWNDHTKNMMGVYKNMFATGAMVDVTLACDGGNIKAHRIVLSSCSSYFHSVFLDNPQKHPIIILSDIKFADLKGILEFMYHGEVNVAEDQLSTFMKAADTLKVKGLTEFPNEEPVKTAEEPSRKPLPMLDTPRPLKRKRRTTGEGTVSTESEDGTLAMKVRHPDADIEELPVDVNASSSKYFSVKPSVPAKIVPPYIPYSFHQQPVNRGVDVNSARNEKFGVVKSTLLDQAPATDFLKNRRSSIQSSAAGAMAQQRISNSIDNTPALGPRSKVPDSSVDVYQQAANPLDIKPELLELE